MTDQIGDNEKKFLMELFKQTKGSVSSKASMYDVGAAIGLDKPEAKRMAEEMMALNLIEVRTLSGGIAITSNGLEKAEEFGAVGSSGSVVGLGNAPVLNEKIRQAVEKILAELKVCIAKSNLNFDMLNELIADIKTAEAQLFSSKPKTAIIRECFCSMKAVLDKSALKDCSAQIGNMMGS